MECVEARTEVAQRGAGLGAEAVSQGSCLYPETPAHQEECPEE